MQSVPFGRVLCPSSSSTGAMWSHTKLTRGIASTLLSTPHARWPIGSGCGGCGVLISVQLAPPPHHHQCEHQRQPEAGSAPLSPASVADEFRHAHVKMLRIRTIQVYPVDSVKYASCGGMICCKTLILGLSTKSTTGGSAVGCFGPAQLLETKGSLEVRVVATVWSPETMAMMRYECSTPSRMADHFCASYAHQAKHSCHAQGVRPVVAPAMAFDTSLLCV